MDEGMKSSKTESIRKERQHKPMYTASRPRPVQSSQSATRIITIAIIMFALAGLISGFAVGAFLRPGKLTERNVSRQPPQVNSAHTPTVTITRSQTPIPLGFPAIDHYQYVEVADGSTTYTFTAHAINKQGQPIHASGITCKIWLTKDGNVNPTITLSRLQSVATLDQPFPHEVQGALAFSSTTPQTQTCNNGQGTWNYTVAPSVEKGLYYIVVLMDWSGVHFNWSWVAIVIK